MWARSLGAQPQRWARCSVAWGTHVLRRHPSPPSSATNGSGPASCCTSISRSWGASGTWGKRIRQDGVQRSPRAGWHHVHVAVDDHTRIAYSEVLPSEGASDAVAFLERAYRWYAQQDITVESVMTDNGSAYRSCALARGLRPPSRFATSAPAPTPRAPTARLNASSRPCSESGPTATPTPPACTAPAPFQAGFAGITSAVPTAPSLASHRLAVSHTSVVSTPSALPPRQPHS